MRHRDQEACHGQKIMMAVARPSNSLAIENMALPREMNPCFSLERPRPNRQTKGALALGNSLEMLSAARINGTLGT